ncbi:hypothetical protein HZA96_00800 [Candidatus Woesearchaeota archaeon]|nr:hypothetical protein [Candidatus Woesearchaeota archaeon]
MNKKRIIKWSIMLIVIVTLLFLIFNSKNAPGKYDQLAKCLTEKGAIMFGTDWCPHCIKQKELFGNSFKYINYKNCDFNKVLCDLNNITGYPTWIYKDKVLNGEQPVEVLASMSGCEVDKQ